MIPAAAAPPTLLPEDALRLREALERSRYTVEGVAGTLGLAGQAALSRGDLIGAGRALPGGTRCSTLLRLFVLGAAVPAADARAALEPLGLERALALNLVAAQVDTAETDAADGDTADGDTADGAICALLDLRPYGEDEPSLPITAGSGGDRRGGSWWVLSDLGSDVRPDAPLRAEHVLGIGAAALTLAQATPREPVRRALDVGTGCGIQALHLTRHAAAVVATDISARALALAAATAALNGVALDLRQGDLLEPARGESFDLIVANPPFVVGPGWQGGAAAREAATGFDYRDSGLEGDAVCERLVRGLPALLAPGGTAQLLANWVIPSDGDWAARVGGWLEGSGCDAWVWQRELADPGEYVSLWLRDAGERPGTDAWERRYTRWLDWFDSSGARAVGMGLITMRRTSAAEPVVVCEDVRQALEQPIGPEIAGWFERAQWLRDHSGPGLADAVLVARSDLVLTEHSTGGPAGWEPRLRLLRQSSGMRWEIEVDEAIAALVAGCTGQLSLRALAAVLAHARQAGADEVLSAILPVAADLVRRGMLLPPEPAAQAEPDG